MVGYFKSNYEALSKYCIFLTSAKQLKISYIFTINTKVSQGWSMLIRNWCMNVSLHNKNESQQLRLPTYSDKFLDHINTLWHFYSCSIYYLSCTDLCSVNIHTHKHLLFFFFFKYKALQCSNESFGFSDILGVFFRQMHQNGKCLLNCDHVLNSFFLLWSSFLLL